MIGVIAAIFVVFTFAEARSCVGNGNLTTDSGCDETPQHCPSNLCPHNATCQVTNNSYICVCPSGFTGNNCESMLQTTNHCEANPCQNNATCTDQNNSFHCSCSPGFTGVFCHTNIDDCASNPCQNGGTCQDGVNSFKCNCPNEFMGKFCEEKYDACVVHRCENGGTCRSDGLSTNFTCSCVSGYDGKLCERNIDDCKDVQCDPFLTCFDLVDGFECRCPIGHRGDRCDEKIDFCESHPCQHGGTCLNGLDNYTCVCPPNFTGSNCESDVDECESEPCGVGICKNSIGSFECYCRPGYSGDRCSINVDECLSAPCFNNGSCVDQVNGYRCNCAPGYTGTRCEVDIDECLSHPCYNNATCTDRVNDYDCVCMPGFTGHDCEVDIDECLSQPCQNEGQCLDHVNGFTCNCTDTGFTGFYCENNIDDCEISSCINGGTCVDLVKDYRCNCFPAYTGKHCDVDIDECADHPCANEAMCLERSNYSYYTNNYLGLFPGPFSYETAHGYACHCKDGFRGENCTENIDDCDPDPCVNGTCVDGINSYTCNCTSGFEGINCELEIDECERFHPCFNGSRCTNTIGDYFCECPENYGGKNCSVELTGCRNNECANNATCEAYLIGETNHTYNCICDHGFYGKLCKDITTVSLNRSQPIAILNLDEIAGRRNLTFRFRTTLRNGVLFFARNSSTYWSLMLKDTSLQLILNGNDLDTKVYELSTNNNDGQWKFVSLDFNPMNITLNLGHNRDDEILIELNQPTMWAFSEFYLGNSPVVISTDQIPFVGCIQDVIYNSKLVTPESLITTPAISKGCPRREQCLEDTCSRNGVCDDLWNTFTCDCRRPFLGQHCNFSVTPATFAHENTTSSVSVLFRPMVQEELQRYFNISLFVRTRKEDGLIFYLGKTNPARDIAFIASELHYGIPIIFVKSGDTTNFFVPKTKRIDNGDYHLLEVVVERYSGLMIIITTTINSTLISNVTTELTTDFVAETLYLGHIPGIQRQRLKRQTPADWFNTNPQVHLPYDIVTDDADGDKHKVSHEYATIMPLEFHDTDENPDLFSASKPRNDFSVTHMPNSKGIPENTFRPLRFEEDPVSEDIDEFEFGNVPFKGVLQDVRVNDKEVLFYPTNPPYYSTKDSYDNVTQNDIVKGVVSDNTCKSQPCQNGGSCNVTFNDYECACVEGFRGRDCSLVDFCYNKQCPEGSRCVNQDDDFECISNATFNGYNSHISYKSNLQNINVTTISFKYRSQHPGAILLASDSQQIRHFAIYLNPDGITLYYPSSTSDNFTFSTNLTDGLPHNVLINLDIKKRVLKIKIDDLENETKSNSDILQAFAILTTGEINVGGNSGKMSSGWSHFKGCLSEIKLDSFILPFFNAQEQGKNASLEKFSIKNVVNVTKGECVLCFNENCQNGGFCKSANESFDCECDGFTGQFCEFDIDECLTVDCNFGVCFNKKGSFDCVCQPGFEGRFCDEDEDECARPEPICENGGVCTNLRGDFSCNCSANFTGKRCENLAIITCDDYPCQNNGDCIPDDVPQTSDIMYKYKCHCTFGYEGRDCERERDFCSMELQQPKCQNGKCVNDAPNGDYRCECDVGYEGRHCEIDIDECKSEPCQNGGSCVDGVNNFTCICAIGFTGDDCSEDVNECIISPEVCHNGATCVNENGTYHCVCPPTFFGINCTHINPCDTNEYHCANGGSCQPYETNVNETELLYICECSEPFFGTHCEHRAEESFDASSLAIILGPVIGCILLIAIVAVVIFFMMARKKRATRGTYSPSRQEMFGSRVELGHVMKPPPEERLI